MLNIIHLLTLYGNSFADKNVIDMLHNFGTSVNVIINTNGNYTVPLLRLKTINSMNIDVNNLFA